jgi:hypothetical protein
VPNSLIGDGTIGCWATASLFGHAPEVQVSRWGLPLITNIFIPDMQMREDFNRGLPVNDLAAFGAQIADIGEKLSDLAASHANPNNYGRRLAERLLPAILPYRIGTLAAFDYAGFNGRGLADDAMDVILTLATNTPLGDGVAPDRSRIRNAFPYFGEPYTRDEQMEVTPAAAPSKP